MTLAEMRTVSARFKVAYGSDKSLVREAGLAAAHKVELTAEDTQHPLDVWLVEFGDGWLNFELIVWIGPGAVNRPKLVMTSWLRRADREVSTSRRPAPRRVSDAQPRD